MEQYPVTGMSCAACSARVEKAVSQVPGVTGCSVSLLTNSMGVEGAASPQSIIAAVEAAGYGAAPKGAGKGVPPAEDGLRGVCPGGHGHCRRHRGPVAASGAVRGLCPGPGHSRTGDQLSLRPGSGHPRGHYGGQRHERKNGILFKTAVSLEEAGKGEIVVLGKTGTITAGTPRVTDLIPVEVTEAELLALACALEQKSDHPLAKAILEQGREAGTDLPPGGKKIPGGGAASPSSAARFPSPLLCGPGPRLWPWTERRPCFSAGTGSSWASSPWRTSSRRTAPRPSGSCGAWASGW